MHMPHWQHVSNVKWPLTRYLTYGLACVVLHCAAFQSLHKANRITIRKPIDGIAGSISLYMIYNRAAEFAQALGCGPVDHYAAVQRMTEQRREANKALKALKDELAANIGRAEVAGLPAGQSHMQYKLPLRRFHSLPCT